MIFLNDGKVGLSKKIAYTPLRGVKGVLLFIVMSILTGCYTPQGVDAIQYQPANPIVEQPQPFSKQVFKDSARYSTDNDPRLVRAYQTYLRTGKAPNITTSGFKQFAYGASQPIISASPFELTVISLQPGESVTNVSSGDPTRWSYSLAYSGQGALKQPHVMIKPIQTGISTDLVITTNKRFYTIKIVATNQNYVRDVRFWYPDDMEQFWKKTNQLQANTITDSPSMDIRNLNFNYHIATDGWFASTPDWKPTRVFDDGTHTYIQFPASMTARDMPALFIQQGDQKELVNYRSKPPYFVVDRLFKQAVLVMGAGQTQTKVIISKVG